MMNYKMRSNLTLCTSSSIVGRSVRFTVAEPRDCVCVSVCVVCVKVCNQIEEEEQRNAKSSVPVQCEDRDLCAC